MSDIQIIWSQDDYDCDTCGGSYAEGAVVYIDGKLILDKPAIAHCYSGQNIESSDVYKEIVKALGHNIMETFSEKQETYQIGCNVV